jgi:isovaleryl-CoA dehydrogenase
MSHDIDLSAIEDLRRTAARVAADILEPNAATVDREAQWPKAGLRALADSGLMGLHVRRELGGHEQGLLALALVTEELGRACSSTGMCFGMHCVASKVLAAKATTDQEKRYLRPIAEGRHITTLALSESGTGAHFFLPRTRFLADGRDFRLDGQKSFVTNGGYADSYVISAVTPGAELDPGTFTCLVMDSNAPGLKWLEPWQGLGMRGNSSRTAQLNQVKVPAANLLGVEGDQIWYLFEIVAPYFLVAMSGVYLGIARAALELTLERLKARTHAHTGQPLQSIPALSDQVSTMWIAIERTRQLVHHAARLGDAGSTDASTALFAAKIDVAEMVVSVTNSAMMLAGGRGYQENDVLARLLRDAQASHVMSPTTHLLRNWLGRAVLGLPLL